MEAGQKFYTVTVFKVPDGGCAFITEHTADSVLPGLVTYKLLNGSLSAVAESEAFETKEAARAECAARLRRYRADVAEAYDKRIAELEAA